MPPSLGLHDLAVELGLLQVGAGMWDGRTTGHQLDAGVCSGHGDCRAELDKPAGELRAVFASSRIAFFEKALVGISVESGSEVARHGPAEDSERGIDQCLEILRCKKSQQLRRGNGRSTRGTRQRRHELSKDSSTPAENARVKSDEDAPMTALRYGVPPNPTLMPNDTERPGRPGMLFTLTDVYSA